MNEPYCEDCKYWGVPDYDHTYRVCLKWVRSDCGQLVPRKHNAGSVVLTAPAFGCNFHEGKPRGPFFVDECCGTDEPCKRWFVMADFNETAFVNTTGLCSMIMRHKPARAISGGLYKEDAEEITEWLNAHWLKREDSKNPPCIPSKQVCGSCTHWAETDDLLKYYRLTGTRYGCCPIYWKCAANSKEVCHLYEECEST